MKSVEPLDKHIKHQLDVDLERIGDSTTASAVAIVSPILPGLDTRLRDALELFQNPRRSLVVVLDTPGGVVEVVQRMVATVRSLFREMIVIVPDRAMSAGTIFALSADRILMDYFSCLGPIDPQIEKEGKLVPALSYLNQFERLRLKSASGELTTAEYALLSKLDLGELYQFEQARELSIELLIDWLSNYKFKDWKETETTGQRVSVQLKRQRAEEIAALLNDANRWHSHGRAIDMNTLRKEVGLRIEDLRDTAELAESVREYFSLLKDYMSRQQLYTFVHTKEYF